MAKDKRHRDEDPVERAKRDPTGFEHDWLTATEEGTGHRRLEPAIEAATGDEPLPDHDPVVNGYRGGDRRLPTPERLGIEGQKPE